MRRGVGAHVHTAAAALPLLACLLGGAAPAAAADTPPGATITFIPPNQTKILMIEPAPTTSTPPTTTAPARARTAAPTATTIPSVSPALRALVEASAAERSRLSAEILALDGRIAGMDADLAAAQSGLAASLARVGELELLVGRARFDSEQAARRVTRLEASAASASDALQVQRTTVARPPTPGHTREDAAAKARQTLAAAVEASLRSSRTLAGLQSELDVARQAAGGTSAELGAKTEEIQRAREALEGLREHLSAAEQAAPVLPTPPASADVVQVPTVSALATATVPGPYMSLYVRAAATCPGLSWTVLAAVGAVESAHGQSNAAGVHSGANYAGAMGPMQFLAGTWAAYRVDGNGDGMANVYDPDDAVSGAANYLCASGAGKMSTLRSALWDYNHADWYVELVLDLAARF